MLCLFTPDSINAKLVPLNEADVFPTHCPLFPKIDKHDEVRTTRSNAMVSQRLRIIDLYPELVVQADGHELSRCLKILGRSDSLVVHQFTGESAREVILNF